MLPTIGLVTSVQTLERNSAGDDSIAAETMAVSVKSENRREMLQYITGSFKIDASVADKAFASMLTIYSANGTKPRAAIEREIEIYRETLQVGKAFTPDDLEDMAF